MTQVQQYSEYSFLGITTPKESRKNNRATPIKKANTKEVVFLEEEEDESSQSESSSDTEKHDFEPEASVSPELEIVHLEQPSPETNKEGAGDLEVATISPDIDDYDLEDAERYFNRQNGTIVCRYCGKSGHKSRDCPEYASSNACFLCGEVDHNARSCPMLVCRQYYVPSFFHLAATNQAITVLRVRNNVCLVSAVTARRVSTSQRLHL